MYIIYIAAIITLILLIVYVGYGLWWINENPILSTKSTDFIASTGSTGSGCTGTGYTGMIIIGDNTTLNNYHSQNTKGSKVAKISNLSKPYRSHRIKS